MCCSDLLFVRGIQSEESSLKVKGNGPQQLQTLDKVMCCIKADCEIQCFFSKVQEKKYGDESSITVHFKENSWT